MSTHGKSSDTHHVAPTSLFLIVWLWLVGITGVEVFLGYIHLQPTLMLTLLIGLSLVKAALIVGYFMHLKYERLSLTLLLIPSTIFCICVALIFFMPDALRLLQMRR
jgi:caa(3)-type oxidase subunit IV